MKKILFVCVILLSCFFLVGCNSNLQKEKFKTMYYSVSNSDIKPTEENGELESGNKWESTSFTLDDIKVTIMYVKDRSVEGLTAFRSKLKKKTINKIDYYYDEVTIRDDYKRIQYHTPDGKNMYTITFYYHDTKENQKKIDTFMKSIEIKK